MAGNYIRTPKHRERMSEIFKGRDCYWLRGKKRPMSKETKDKISKTKTGKHHSEETKQKLSLITRGINNPNYGNHFSEETKRKISEALKGKHPSIETRSKMSESRKGKHLSEGGKQKLSLAKKGEKSYLWKGGITPFNKLMRQGINYKTWRKTIFTRDNYTCQMCGQYGGYLIAHHINNFAEYPELILEINNGIILCEECHRKFHKTFGKKGNTEEQIKIYVKLLA